MKKLLITYAVLAIIVVSAVAVMGKPFSKEKKAAIVDNLYAGITSENPGIRTSSAYVLGQLIDDRYIDGDDASELVIPLMQMLDNAKNDKEKIVAVLALYKIGDPVGIYRLKGVSKFDSSERVRKTAHNFYIEYHKLNGTEYLTYNEK